MNSDPVSSSTQLRSLTYSIEVGAGAKEELKEMAMNVAYWEHTRLRADLPLGLP